MELLHIGIYAFITCKNQISNLFDAIEVVSKGAIYRTSIMTEALYMNKEASVKVKETGIDIILNDREKKIIELLWKGKNDKEISSLIFRSVSSVEKLKYELKEKIGVKSIPELFNYALKMGIISLT
ncbi:Oxygen regulatory protein NreC [compost metagenome]